MLGVIWRDHAPFLRLRREGEPTSVVEPVAGLRLAYRLIGDGDRVCVGHVPFRQASVDYVDCDDAPEVGGRTCRRCSIVEATFASNLHHAHTRGSAELDPAIVDHLRQPNRLYLAAFRDGSLKVGTSTVVRAERRLEEQGAWMARFVAETADGRTVRHLEDLVTERLGIAQATTASRKARGLVDPIDDVELAARLTSRAAEVSAEVVVPAADHLVLPLDEPWRNPMADHKAGHSPLRYPLSLGSGRHDLEFVTAVGRHLLGARGSDIFVFDPAPLFGIWLEVGDFGSDEIVIQDALF